MLVECQKKKKDNQKTSNIRLILTATISLKYCWKWH